MAPFHLMGTDRKWSNTFRVQCGHCGVTCANDTNLRRHMKRCRVILEKERQAREDLEKEELRYIHEEHVGILSGAGFTEEQEEALVHLVAHMTGKLR